jgi:hypothetical protein
MLLVARTFLCPAVLLDARKELLKTLGPVIDLELLEQLATR